MWAGMLICGGTGREGGSGSGKATMAPIEGCGGIMMGIPMGGMGIMVWGYAPISGPPPGPGPHPP